ncbi:MAG: hypothetical protein K940chlam9_02070 [Chlamydiae bacterium]|nr:hypothetical protein [Chlamydiota bacterium]
MPRQSSGSCTSSKPAFKSVGSSCCPHRYPLRENGRHIFAKHDLETAQKICRSLGETEIKESPLISPIQIQYPEDNHAYPATLPSPRSPLLPKTRTLFFFVVFSLRE